MRIDLGCGDHPTLFGPDVVYVDARRVAAQPLTICDLWEPLPFDDATFVEAVAQQVLEHAPHKKVRSVLKEWVRILAPGGKLHVEVPNLSAWCRQFADHPLDENAIFHIYGAQDLPDDCNVHRNGFSPELLERMLTGAGLRAVTVQNVGFALVAEGYR